MLGARSPATVFGMTSTVALWQLVQHASLTHAARVCALHHTHAAIQVNAYMGSTIVCVGVRVRAACVVSLRHSWNLARALLRPGSEQAYVNLPAPLLPT